jgi:hypothetical protein
MANKFLVTTATMWGTIGFIRGVQSYNFETTNPTKLYTDQLMNGLVGVFFYINPLTFTFMLYKEVYRLEVKAFNIKREKEGNFYNKLII